MGEPDETQTIADITFAWFVECECDDEAWDERFEQVLADDIAFRRMFWEYAKPAGKRNLLHAARLRGTHQAKAEADQSMWAADDAVEDMSDAAVHTEGVTTAIVAFATEPRTDEAGAETQASVSARPVHRTRGGNRAVRSIGRSLLDFLTLPNNGKRFGDATLPELRGALQWSLRQNEGDLYKTHLWRLSICTLEARGWTDMTAQPAREGLSVADTQRLHIEAKAAAHATVEELGA